MENKYGFSKLIVVIALSFFVTIAFFGYKRFYKTKINQMDNTATDSIKEINDKDDVYFRNDADLTKVKFDNLGISLQIPKSMYVEKEPLVNLNNPELLESYIFYIQNYGRPDLEETGNFQMYGTYQFGLAEISWERLSEVKNDSTIYEYVKEIKFNDVRGYETKLSGERNNYVYLLHLDNRVLRIAVSEANLENKALADQILNTLSVFSPKTDQLSHMQKVEEPTGYYSVLIPDNWSYKYNDTKGARLSELIAESNDFKYRVEDVDGPHSNVYYESGIEMMLTVFEGNLSDQKPVMSKEITKRDIYINGIGSTLYTFLEPSTMKGEIKELSFSDGKYTYVLRFNYLRLNSAPEGYDGLIDNIVANLTITTEQITE